MRVLVAGGSGQVGSALRASAPADVEVYAPSSGQMDIRQSDSVRSAVAALKPQLVVNAAAYTQVEGAEDEPELAAAVNDAGAGNLAAACADCPLIHLSTDYVFDGARSVPYREDDATAPLNVYGRSKLAGERAVRARLERHLILRVSWVFSPTGANFVRTMLGASHRDEVRVVNDQHGTPCAAASIAAAIWRIAAQLDEARRFGTYHFATAPPTTWHEFAETIYAFRREADPAGPTPKVLAIPTSERVTRAARPRHSVLNAARLARDYGVSPPDWRDDLRRVVFELVGG